MVQKIPCPICKQVYSQIVGQISGKQIRFVVLSRKTGLTIREQTIIEGIEGKVMPRVESVYRMLTAVSEVGLEDSTCRLNWKQSIAGLNWKQSVAETATLCVKSH